MSGGGGGGGSSNRMIVTLISSLCSTCDIPACIVPSLSSAYSLSLHLYIVYVFLMIRCNHGLS